MDIRKILTCGSASVACAAFASHAVGQGAPAAAATAVQAGTTIGEVVVTAQRREQSLEKVPVAITAFTQQMLKERSISQIADLDRAVPGLSVVAGSGTTNQASFAIRGRGLNYGAAAGSVETYFADVPLSGPFQMPSMGPQFFDLQSLQVLKGPQGTLFGRSTTGGAVLFVPQAPTDQFGGYIRAQAGDYSDYQLEAAVNLPLAGDKADLRLAGFDWSRAGYSHTLGSIAGASPVTGPFKDLFGNLLPSQTYDNQDVQGFRATLLVRPTDKLRNSTIFAYNSIDNRDTPKAVVFNPASKLGGGELALYPYLQTLPDYVSAVDVNLDHKANTSWAVINTTTYDLTSDLTLKNIFGYIDSTGFTNEANDSDGSPLAGIDLPLPPRQSQIFQTTDEVQLQGRNFNDRLTWIVGGLLDEIRSPSGNNIDIYGLNYNGHFDALWEKNTDTAYGLYGSFTYKLTDQFSVTAGERHSWDNINVFSEEAGTNVALTPAQQAAAFLANVGMTPAGAAHTAGWLIENPGQDSKAAYQGDTYNISLEYHPTNTTMIYGGYRRGFKPGGFNPKSPIGVPSEASFAPETDDDFYVGLKTRFDLAGMPGRFNIEGYWDLYHNKQVSYLTLASQSGAVPGLATVTINAPGTTYRGIDADVVLDATPWLRLSANYSYIDAFFTSWPDNTFPGSTLNLAVNPVAYVSPNKVSATARFHAELPDGKGEIAFAPTVSYEDKWYSLDNAYVLPRGETFYLNQPANFNEAALGGAVIPGYSIVDLRFEWNRLMGTKVDAAVNVTNLTNTYYAVGSTGTLAFGVESRSYGPPRMFTFELSTKF
jgi:iron complex outermembrane receptor protein